jgi:hypothetical protein
MEEWKDILGYEGIYKINSQGLIKSLKTNRIRSSVTKNNGYECVCLSKNGTYRQFLVHRLVAEAFLPNPHKMRCISHINGNKMDNRVENIAWINTLFRLENISHQKPKGKLTREQVMEILSAEKGQLLGFETKYGITKRKIHDIRVGRAYLPYYQEYKTGNRTELSSEIHGRRLNIQQVAQIYCSNEKVSLLAAKFGCPRPTISRIKRGKTYRQFLEKLRLID